MDSKAEKISCSAVWANLGQYIRVAHY